MPDSTKDDDAKPAAASRAAVPSSKIDDEAWDEAVNDWIANSLRNSAMSAAPSEAWNHLLSVLPELRKLLRGKI